ncbi:MAG: thioredoxin domain-containing protein [Lachnospiraceae bacterium]|nr:thioredoxin domain-containing protein [Lachnospiraceae bacterium]
MKETKQHWQTEEYSGELSPREGNEGNRLLRETSPYLLQHAHNPIDWYPWCEEAFARARGEEKPVFLSIGYSTCHWCHVMAEESFEDKEVAELLNRYFISIKVDREERPDIDAVYMAACQAFTGSGGWPLTAILDEEQRPFFVGTYLPRTSRFGRTGLLELLQAVQKQWTLDRESLKDTGHKITEYLKALEQERSTGQGERREVKGEEEANFERLLSQAEEWFQHQFDPVNGGFGRAPKFPQAHQLLFLLRYGAWKKEKAPMDMAEKTLLSLYRGGIFDQIGGGFSRYSTDQRWLVPHFEKMLYDNALLALAYTEAFSQTGKPEYREAVTRIFTYAERELLQDEGGFSCGQDADSGGEEGKYYLFAKEEILDVLGEERGKEFCQFYDITQEGNFEGKNIPNRLGQVPQERPFWWQEALDLLLHYRQERSKLHLDDKVLTAWNSLMIWAYAQAARVFQEPSYKETARVCMQFVQKHLKTPKGRLLIRWRKGQAAFAGQLEDYTFYSLANLELYETFGEKRDFMEAVGVLRQLEPLFGDAGNGGYFRYSQENEPLIIRPKEAYDGAIPSGNGAAALAFAKVYNLTGDPAFGKLRDAQLTYIAREAQTFPAGHTMGLLAFLEAWKGENLCKMGEASQECQKQAERYGWLHHVQGQGSC